MMTTKKKLKRKVKAWLNGEEVEVEGEQKR